MHLTVLEFTSILPVPFPEIQILIIIDKKKSFIYKLQVNMPIGFTQKTPSHIQIATVGFNCFYLSRIWT